MTLWMGPNYHVSYLVMLIMCLGALPWSGVMMGQPIYSGLNKVRVGAFISLGQGVLNLGLSLLLVLVWKMGILGVAWGTFVPRALFSVAFGLMAMRWIGLPFREFASRLLWRWAAVAGSFTVICLGIQSLPVASCWPWFAAKVILAGVLYVPLAWSVLLTRGEKQTLRMLATAKLTGGVVAQTPE